MTFQSILKSTFSRPATANDDENSPEIELLTPTQAALVLGGMPVPDPAQLFDDGDEGDEANEGNEDDNEDEGNEDNEGDEANEGDESNENDEGDENNEGNEGNEGDEGDECNETALLHKLGSERTSPFPGRTYPTGSVTGMPRAV